MAVTTINNGLSQEKGVNYTVITDSSADWASVANSTYFYDKTDGLPHYKDGSGNVLEVFASGGGHEIYSGTDVTPLPQQPALRFKGYLEAVDDAVAEETQVDLSSTALKESNVTRFGVNGSDEVDLKIVENTLLTGDSNGFATTLTGTEGSLIGFGASNEVQEFEAIEVYNILKEENITADKTLALLDISGISSNVKAKFNIDTIAFQNNTANSVTVNVGTTVGGTDVVNALVIGANALVLAPLGTTFFSTTSGQNLFISSALWNSASVNIHVTISKIWQ